MTKSRGVNPLKGQRGSLEERYSRQVVRNAEGCWGWTGTRTRDGFGYGLMGRGGRGTGLILAHRASWLIHNGEIPKGMCVLHHCDNPPCTRPDHLWLGTRFDNNRDMTLKGRARRIGGGSGEDHPMAKLTWEQVRNIRTFAAMGRPAHVIAPAYGMSVRHIKRIIAGKAWHDAN